MLALCTTVIVLERQWWKCVCCMHLLQVLVQLDRGGECKRLAVIQEAGLWK